MNKQEKEALRQASKRIAAEANSQKLALRQEIQQKKAAAKDEKAAQRKSPKPIKKKVKKIRKTVIDILPIRQYTNNHFLLSDGSIMDIFQVAGKSYYNATDDDIAHQVDQLAYFFRIYKHDLKLVALNYPTNTGVQQAYINSKLADPRYKQFYPLLMEKKDSLNYLEQHTTTRELFLFLYAEKEEQYDTMKTLVFAKSSLHLMTLSQEKKEKILFLQNNMCKEINR